MERESNPMEALCRSGCGFYGNPSTDGLCSVCFKEALKKKQQPPTTTPSPVSAPFVPAAPAPTPLAAAAPTVPSLPAQPQPQTDTQGNKTSMMENDQNKKDSKGKRILKKASRRNSKSSNGSQSSAVEQSIGTSRSQSFGSHDLSIEIKDDSPRPRPDGTGRTEEAKSPDKILPYSRGGPSADGKLKKIVEIKEEQNEFFGETSSVLATSAKSKTSPKLVINEDNQGTAKTSLKRKLDEESGAGTSGTSAGNSDTDADDKDPSKDKKKKNRCAVCRKKVGLTGFECRCGGLFCAVHRYSDKHECSFDYRELGAQEIRRNNPVVVSQKIHKI